MPTTTEQRRLRAPLILAALVAVHVGLVLSVATAERSLIRPLHNDTVHRLGPGADFLALYHAAVNLDRGADPYANDPDGVTPYWYPYRYLPAPAHAARLLLPLGPMAAYRAWVVVLEMLLAVVVAVVWRRARRGRLWLAAMLLLGSPYLLEVHMGQFTFAATALCGLGLIAPRGAAAWCLAAVIKPVTLVTSPAVARTARGRRLVAWGLVCVLIAALPLLGHGDRLLHFVNTNLRPSGGLDAGNYGLVYTVRLLLERWPAAAGLWDHAAPLLRLAVLAGTAWLAFRARRRHVLAGAATLLLAHQLTYLHSWEHHYSGILAIYALWFAHEPPGRWPAVVAGVCLALIALPTPFVLLDRARDPAVWDPSTGWPPALKVLLAGSKAVPAAALFALSVRRLTAAGKEKAAPESPEPLPVAQRDD